MTAGSDTLTISDDDPPPTALSLQLSPAAVGEDAASTQITATVSLNNSPVPDDIQVTVSPASAGEAVPGTDYPAISEFTITIPEGQTSATGQFPFDPTQDGLAEGDERIILSATATDLTAATAALTINDDDDPPTAVTLSLSTTTLTEDAAPTPTTLTADLVGSPVPWATSVTVSASGGTAHRRHRLPGHRHLRNHHPGNHEDRVSRDNLPPHPGQPGRGRRDRHVQRRRHRPDGRHSNPDDH